MNPITYVTKNISIDGKICFELLDMTGFKTIKIGTYERKPIGKEPVYRISITGCPIYKCHKMYTLFADGKAVTEDKNEILDILEKLAIKFNKKSDG